MSRRALLEVCVEDARGLAAAIEGGADRIELCAALSVGGLTPPASLIREAARASLPVHLLARPRSGDFVYDRTEQALVADDMRTAAEAGLAGVVIGASHADGSLDEECLARWVAIANTLGGARGRPLSLTLHRAFDLVPDLPAALETAVTLGFDRVLTSGGQPRAIDGVAMLARLAAQAGDRIRILAGSGVSLANVDALLDAGVHEVHASCRRASDGPVDPALLRFGFVEPAPLMTDAHLAAGLAARVKATREPA